MKARYGLSLPSRGVLFGATTIDETIELAEVADRSGLFDSVWIGDSLFAKPRPESITLLAAIAARTSRVRLGTCCLSTFPLRDPIFLAAQWTGIDLVSRGRTVLGACIGGTPPREKAEAEFAPFKVRLEERAARMEEGITILRRLWTEEHVTHAGRFWQFRDLTLEPRPIQKPCPPIWIATNPKPELAPAHVIDRALQRVGLMADGWMTDATPVARFRQRWATVRAVAREAGRDAGRLESALHVMVNINDDRAKAVDEATRFLREYYGAAITPEKIEIWLACGSPAAVLATVRAYVEVGCTLPILRFASWDQRGQLRRALEELMPAACELDVTS